MRKRLFSYVLCTLTLFSATVGTAQVAERSRLRIGEDPKPKTVTTETLSAFIVNPKIHREISFNKLQTVNEFYRQLLLPTKSNSAAIPAATTAKVAASSEVIEDALFDNAKIHVSNIYPNPANAFAKIDYEIKSGNPKAELTFYDMLSRKVTTYELNSFDRSIRIDTQTWDAGLYLYQLIIDGKKVATKKLLVRRN